MSEILLMPNGPLRPLWVGVAFMACYALSTHLAWLAALGLRRWHRAGAIRVRRWAGWGWLGEVLPTVVALAVPYAMLLGGVFTASDIGVGAVDWGAAWPWVASITAVAAVWVTLLWGEYWRKRPEALALSPRPGSGTLLAQALRQEAVTATFRGALMPVIGAYWGVWGAVLWAWLTRRSNPWLAAQLQHPGQRPWVVLGWGLDWVGATLYILSGSIWPALAARLLCAVLVAMLQRRLLALRERRQAAAAASADEQGQRDEHGETGRGEDADALQIP